MKSTQGNKPQAVRSEHDQIPTGGLTGNVSVLPPQWWKVLWNFKPGSHPEHFCAHRTDRLSCVVQDTCNCYQMECGTGSHGPARQPGLPASGHHCPLHRGAAVLLGQREPAPAIGLGHSGSATRFCLLFGKGCGYKAWICGSHSATRGNQAKDEASTERGSPALGCLSSISEEDRLHPSWKTGPSIVAELRLCRVTQRPHMRLCHW